MITSLPRDLPVPGEPMPKFGPSFTLSHSKARQHDECPRAWWLATNAAWNGWPQRNGPQPSQLERQAYTLGKAQSLAGLSGELIHEAAYAWIKGGVTADLLATWQSAVDLAIADTVAGKYRQNAKEYPPVEEWLYEESEDFRARNMARCQETAARCFANINAMPLFISLREAWASKTLRIESGDLKTMWVEDLAVWILPDMVDVMPDRVVIYDIKTGRQKPEDHAQVQLYAEWATREFGRPALGQLIYLAEGAVVEVDTSEAARAAAAASIYEAAAAIRPKLEHPQCNKAPEEAFPRRPVEDGVCRWCRYSYICNGLERDRSKLAQSTTEENLGF